MKNNLKKNFVWNLIGSTFNSFTSLFFLIIVIRINGIDISGIFTFAFSNACLLQVIGIYSTRVYQVTEKNKNITDNDYIYTKLITIFLMILIGFLYGLIRGYNQLKLLIIVLLIIFKALDAFSESIYAIMQRNDQLYKVGISLLIKGIIGTIMFFIVDILTNNIVLSISSLIVSNLLIILLYDFRVIKKLKFYIGKFNFNNCLSILKLSFWTFLFTLLTQYLINSPKYAIDNYLNNDSQTIYGIISMPATIMVLISNFIIHPFILEVNNCVNEKTYKKLNNILLKMIFSISIISIIGLISCYFFGIPMLNLLYKIDLKNYLNELLIIILGASVFAITIIISNVLVAMRSTLSQTIIYLLTSIFAFFISRMFVNNLSVLGATYSYLLSMLLLLFLYLLIYIYKIKKENKNEYKIINNSTNI